MECLDFIIDVIGFFFVRLCPEVDHFLAGTQLAEQVLGNAIAVMPNQ
jgi:hypothetical protein